MTRQFCPNLGNLFFLPKRRKQPCNLIRIIVLYCSSFHPSHAGRSSSDFTNFKYFTLIKFYVRLRIFFKITLYFCTLLKALSFYLWLYRILEKGIKRMYGSWHSRDFILLITIEKFFFSAVPTVDNDAIYLKIEHNRNEIIR